jgi:O-antigen ligase
MQQLVVSRWFRLADLFLVSASGAIWYFWPQASFWPLLMALLAWVARGTALRFPFKPGVISLSLVVFVLTAGAGVWAAPQPEMAWGKFWVLVGAVLLFYALADQPRKNLWLVAGLAGLFGLCLSVSFILVSDWHSLPADLRILNQITSLWASARPDFPARAINPNMVGGILAMIFPFPLALGLNGLRTRNSSLVLASVVTCGIVAAGLALTSSRGAWLALVVSLGVWFLWGLSGIIAFRAGYSRTAIFAGSLSLTVIPLAWFAFSFPGGLTAISSRLPGMDNWISRVGLAGSTLRLIEDFPYTGGGLGSFPGLYSQYIRVTPFFQFAYSHNFYLDVALEQGVIGFAALMVVLSASVWMALSRLRDVHDTGGYQLLSGAVLAGLVTVCLHGLVDDALYGAKGTPLIFLLPGVAVALTRLEMDTHSETVLQRTERDARPSGVPIQVWTVVMIVVFGVTLAALSGWHRPLAAAWYANLGAVHLAAYELRDFPTGKWTETWNETELAKVEDLFVRAEALNPKNRTAHHRLGLIAMSRRDFETAQTHLEVAYHLDPGHRGVRKVLGYCYVWNGHQREALEILKDIPEAGSEMRVYTWWWKTQGQIDLANQAANFAVKLTP